MAKTLIVEVTVPEGKVAGDTFKIEIEIPTAPKRPRGQLAGIDVADMTDEQLKREKINANSVLYKAKQRGAADEIIEANQARVDRVLAEFEVRGLNAPKAAKFEAVATVVEDDVEAAEDMATEL